MFKKLAAFLQGEQGVSISNNLNAILIGLLAFQISMFASSMIFKKSILLLHVFTLLLIFFAYVLFKDKAEDSSKELGLTILKISLIIFATAMINHLFIGGIEKILEPSLKESMSKVMIFADLAIIVSMFALMKSEKVEEFLSQMKDASTIELLSGGVEEIQPGDAILGTDVDTKKPVRLPLKDRYLHMLILGPTGSGKTSQTIIPMIHRDMQNPDLGITVIEPKGKYIAVL